MVDRLMLDNMAILVAQDRLARWGYDKTLDVKQQIEFVDRQRMDFNLLADLTVVLEIIEEAAAEVEDEFDQPCQPIGCDNGYHLKDCAFAESDGAFGG